MNNLKKITLLGFIMLLNIPFVLLSAKTCFAAQPDDQQWKELAKLRAAGINGDQSQVPRIIADLKTPAHRDYVKASLHSLAQLGATEALPAVNVICQDTSDRDDQAYARVAKARLLAENSAKSASDLRSQAATKISRFYQELGLTPTDLNKALQSNGSEAYQPQSVEVYAVREVADMVYHGNYMDYAPLDGVNQIDYHRDYPTALKMRLAAFMPENRLDVIIQELQSKKTLTIDDNYEIQLAADEELVASRAVANQLIFMDNHHNQFGRNGFVALFQILECVPDDSQAKLLQKFSQDADGGIAHYARPVYYSISQGIVRVRAIGY